MRRSHDQGNTWDDFRIIVDAGEQVADNPTLICDQITGHIHLLYQVGYASCFHIVSEDEGVNWSKPIEITDVFDKYRTVDNYHWKVIAVGPGHGIQLANGRFIVPVWLATDHSHRPSISSTIFSDNQGKTWHRGEVVLSNTKEMPNPSESVAIELADGRVVLNSRCESERFRRVVCFSRDGASGWTQPRFQEDLFDPVCMASLIRLSKANPDDKNRILFSNPNSEHTSILANGKRERSNLTIRLSYDEGETWPVARQLVAGSSGYSDLAVGKNGLVYCLFENQNLDKDAMKFVPLKIAIARFNLPWISHGKDNITHGNVGDEASK
jgi:sialidase-1